MSNDLLLDQHDPDIDILLHDHQKLSLLPNNEPEGHFTEFVTPFNHMILGSESRYNPYDKENWWVTMDHCYSRPWNWRPESTFLRPTKTLFIPKIHTNKRKPANPLAPVLIYEEVIDIEGEPDEPTPIYDRIRARNLMGECERHAALARVDEGNEDWEESISRMIWIPTQNRLFNGMISILNNHNLARLANTNARNEPIARRACIDKSVERVRKLMATVAWDPKYTQWLHQLLIDHLNKQYLAAYLDILQSLKTKVPTLVDKMMNGANSSRLSVLSYESLLPLLKRPWDPVAASLMQDKPKKLPGNPIIVVVPSTPVASKRILKWVTLLSNLATVVTVSSNYGSTSQKMTMTNYVDQMFVMTRSKLQDLRADYPGRNIVLLGFNFGSTLALQVAQVEQVLCVICLGFALQTAEGRRGDPDDNLLELQCPVLFMVGQCSNTSLQEDMENLRERMRVETGLIIVGSADDNLRITKKKKKEEGITQGVVDRCIADEVGEFISGVILSPYPPQIRQSPTNLTPDGPGSKKVKLERKRYNSNTSSLDSEPPSPTPRISRPGENYSPYFGRPPGSKSKTKLEGKWATQGIPPSPSSSPSPICTPDTSSNDSSLTDKTLNLDTFSPKKIKVLKPTVYISEKNSQSSNTTISSPKPSTAKALNFQNRTLSNLLQTDITTSQSPTKSAASGIKVLENVKITAAGNARIFPNSARTFDISKITKMNNANPGTGNSIVLLPDGKIKNISSCVKAPSGGRYITSKRQLVGNIPPKPFKKVSYVSQTCSLQPSSLPPPTNLTTQDIMDLPIIFADDHQMLDATSNKPETKSLPQIITTPSSKLLTNNPNKFVLINKQISIQNTPSSFIISNNSRKINPQIKTGPKYTKIILSSKRVAPVEEVKTIPNIIDLPSEISVRKIVQSDTPPTGLIEVVDLENEIAATTVYKSSTPDGATMDKKEYQEEGAISVVNEAIVDKIANLPETRTVLKRSAEISQLESDVMTPNKIPKLDVL